MKTIESKTDAIHHGPKAMASKDDATIQERLAIFDEEADFDDWGEIFIGGLITLFGLWQMMTVVSNPSESFVHAPTMIWIAAGVIVMGMILAAHGLKDMAVKEVRESVVRLEAANRQGSIDYGLIRDVLLHQDQYRKFLLEAYEEAYEDGVLSQDELDELKILGEALNLTEEEAGQIATRAAINAAIRDGSVDEEELKLIIEAAGRAGLDEEKVDQIREALMDGKIDEAEKELLDQILGKVE